MSSFRTEKAYIQRKTLQRLWMVLSLYPTTYDDLTAKCRSADDLLDAIANIYIKEHYPETLEAEKQKDKIEQQLALKIRGNGE